MWGGHGRQYGESGACLNDMMSFMAAHGDG